MFLIGLKVDLICFFWQLHAPHATSHDGSLGAKGIFSIKAKGSHFHVTIS